ncbi:MAG: cysteine hydrolase family protein [Bacilli bacterium]|jgi:nicotinamidase/pyrazinamidase
MVKKRLLIVVDYQNDFVDGALGFSDANTIEQVIINAIEDHLKTKDDIVFTKDTHFDNYLDTEEGRNLPIKHCIKGTKGHQIYGKVATYLPKAKKVYEKLTFGSLEMANDIVKKGYNEITLVGLVTNICILSNALLAKAALPEAKVVVLKDGVNSYDKDLHAKTLDVLQGTQIIVR